jgi:hypothetical protein
VHVAHEVFVLAADRTLGTIGAGGVGQGGLRKG